MIFETNTLFRLTKHHRIVKLSHIARSSLLWWLLEQVVVSDLTEINTNPSVCAEINPKHNDI